MYYTFPKHTLKHLSNNKYNISDISYNVILTSVESKIMYK